MKLTILAALSALSFSLLPMPANATVPPHLPAAQSGFDSGSLHADVYGTPGKRALILIPGLDCGPWVWGNEVRRFGPSYTIYALTLPGFDGRPNLAPPLFQTVSSDFWTMLQQHGITKPIVIGQGLGGTLGIDLATQHSERLGGAVAIDGLPAYPIIESLPPEQRSATANYWKTIALPSQFVAWIRGYMLPSWVTSSSDAAAIANASRRTNPVTAAQWYYEHLTIDLRGAMKNANVPLLEIGSYTSWEKRWWPSGGDKQRYYASLLAGASNARVVIVAPSQDLIMYDQPAKLDAAIGAFLQSIP